MELTGAINKGSKLSPEFTWSVYFMERADVPNVLYTECISWIVPSRADTNLPMEAGRSWSALGDKVYDFLMENYGLMGAQRPDNTIVFSQWKLCRMSASLINEKHSIRFCPIKEPLNLFRVLKECKKGSKGLMWSKRSKGCQGLKGVRDLNSKGCNTSKVCKGWKHVKIETV